MKVVTPEISWHGKEAVFSIDFQCIIKEQPKRLATAGLDTNVRVSSMLRLSSLLEAKCIADCCFHQK